MQCDALCFIGGSGLIVSVVVVCSGHPSGFLATTPDEYASHLFDIFSSYFPSPVGPRFDALQRLRSAAQARAAEFSDECFAVNVVTSLASVMPK